MIRDRKCSRCKTLLIPPLIFSYCRLSNAFTRPMYAFRNYLKQGILNRFCLRLNTPCLDKSWETGKFRKQTMKSLTTTGCSNNWSFMDTKLFRLLLVFKTFTLVFALTMPTCPSYPTKWSVLNPAEILPELLPGNLGISKDMPSVELMMIVSLFLYGRLGSAPALVYQSWLWLDLLNSVHAKLFNMIHMGTIYGLTKLNQWFYRLTTGLVRGWVHYLVLWVARLRSTR